MQFCNEMYQKTYAAFRDSFAEAPDQSFIPPLSSICHERAFYVDGALCYPQPP